MENGAQGRNRTTDTRIFSAMLYQLSYLGIRMRPAGRERPSSYGLRPREASAGLTGAQLVFSGNR